MPPFVWRVTWGLAAVQLAGCSSRPEAVSLPRIDRAQAAAAAVDQCDTNGDGVLSDDELAASPGLAAARSAIDTDNDGRLSREEIAARIGLYTRRGAGVKSVFCTVTLDGRPLENAHIELTPEPFLGEEVMPAQGISAGDGSVPLSVDRRALPSDLAGIAAVHQGMYRVRITHEEQDLPARYNTNTILGCEVGPTTRRVDFELRSR